jgi:hypothetical protein
MQSRVDAEAARLIQIVLFLIAKSLPAANSP